MSDNVTGMGDSALYVITYLKLRVICGNAGGNVPSLQIVANQLGLSEKTTRRHLAILCEKLGYLRRLDNGVYQIVSTSKVTKTYGFKRFQTYTLDTTELDKFSYKTLREFRALLCSLLEDSALLVKEHVKEEFIEKNSVIGEALKKHNKTKAKRNQYSSSRRGTENVDLRDCSLGYSASLIKKSISTVSKYHTVIKRDNKHVYNNKRIVHPFKAYGAEDIPFLNKHKEDFVGTKYGKFLMIRGFATFNPITRKLFKANKLKFTKIRQK